MDLNPINENQNMIQKVPGLPLSEKDKPIMENLSKNLVKDLQQVYEIITQTLGNKTSDQFHTVEITRGSIKITFRGKDGSCEGVYEDPPGWCRGC